MPLDLWMMILALVLTLASLLYVKSLDKLT
jgi:hypothetical protein